MRLTLLGTGSAMPTGDRYQTGYLIETNDCNLLVDCGAGVLQRIAQSPIEYTEIDALLLSHHHLDHIADVFPLLKARWLADADTLPIFGPPGTETLMTQLSAAHDYLEDKLELTVTDIQPPTCTVAGIEIGVHETIHSMQCFAYRFEGPAGDLTLSGDTEADEDVISFADGSAVLVHDCSFPDGIDVTNHPTPSQLASVLSSTEIGEVILTHLYPHTNGYHEEMLATISEGFSGRVRICPDEYSLSIGADNASE